METTSGHEVKKLKRHFERPLHEESKQLKKLRKFRKANRIEEVRTRKWLNIYEEDEESDDLKDFEKIRKISDRYNSVEVSGKTFSRPDPNLGKRKEKAVASNIDQIVIVASIKSPPLKAGLIDRFLVIAEKKGFDVLICINKIDLITDDTGCIDDISVYKDLGYKILFTSARKNTGIKELKEYFKDRCSLFIGHSGVGKSSLLNALDPSLNLKVGEISTSTNKGKHTTTSTRLLRLSFGGEVFDSPGIKQFGLSDISRKELSGLFREFKDKICLCEFPDCSHIEEKNCGIKKSVLSGKISEQRYDSYLRIYKTL